MIVDTFDDWISLIRCAVTDEKWMRTRTLGTEMRMGNRSILQTRYFLSESTQCDTLTGMETPSVRTATVFLFLVLPLLVDAQSVHRVDISDSTRWGSFNMAQTGDWWLRTSEDAAPVRVRIHAMDSIRSLPQWRGYGIFETTIEIDSIISARPWVLGYYSPGGVRIWLNDELVLRTGHPSPTPEGEVLGRFLTVVDRPVHLNEGQNTLRIEYSEHTVPFRFANGLGNVRLHMIDLYLKKPNPESFQRRHRAFIFGGILLILLTLILLHGFLSIQFKNDYHRTVMLTIGFIALHAFTTMSDSMIDWTFAYATFFELSYATTFIFVVYYFSLSLRHYYRLPLHVGPMRIILAVSLAVALYGAFHSRNPLHILHPLLAVMAIGYGVWTMRLAKRASKDNEIGILLAGFTVTMAGTIGYSLLYLTLGFQSNELLIFSALTAYSGLPIALTFNIAKSYSGLFKTMEMKVIERTAQLQQANEYKSRFFANISHEFRTPLTIARGLLDRLSGRRIDDMELQSELSPVQRNLSRLGDMVNQIVDLTKSDYDQMALNRKVYRVDSIVTLSVESFRSLAEHRQQTLVFTSETPEVAVLVDRLKFEIMINNLVSNAIKYTPKGGTIRVTTSQRDGRFHLSVEDTGRGIPPEELDAIFERFHRIKQNDTEYVEGMGIGLELSRTLARLHGGDIRLLESEPGLGSTFDLELPMSDAAESEDILQDFDTYFHSITRQGAGESGDRILLVEDNDDMAAYITDVLQDVGQIHRAIHGEEALSMLAVVKPELIITDLMMPKMSGSALIAELRKRDEWFDVPVVVLTAKALEADKLDLLRIGVVDYITKPFSVDELVFKSRTLLNLGRKRKKARIILSAEEASLDRERLTPEAAEWVKANIRDQSLSVDVLADHLHISRRTLYRLIEAETGMSSAEFIREIRLQTARQLLQNSSSATLEQVAEAVGYASGRNFRKLYHERFGVHPLDELKRA